jgi:hypothetical protein
MLRKVTYNGFHSNKRSRSIHFSKLNKNILYLLYKGKQHLKREKFSFDSLFVAILSNFQLSVVLSKFEKAYA